MDAQRVIPQSTEYYNLMVKARRALIRLKNAQKEKFWFYSGMLALFKADV
jgi:hypothetical protein